MSSESTDADLLQLMRLIADNEVALVLARIESEPALSQLVSSVGATRLESTKFFLAGIKHYIYAGDSALHVAAAGFRTEIVQALLAQKASCVTANRRGALPIHYAADTNTWHPEEQAHTIQQLIEAGSPLDARDLNGTTPLHRAVRSRGASAVAALLAGGASPNLGNESGSSPLHLAVQTTGRGGSGTARAREQQERIISLLLHHGADRDARNVGGKTAAELAPPDLRHVFAVGDSS
jgi:ankyrin repeat protein